MHKVRWTIAKCTSGEFVVPDNSFFCRMLPLEPKICLFADSKDAEIDDAELAKINEKSIRNSSEYYFARDLSKCPTEKP